MIFIQFGSDYCDIDGALFGLQGPLLYPTNQKDVLLFMGLEIGSKQVRVDVLKLNQLMQSVQYVGNFFADSNENLFYMPEYRQTGEFGNHKSGQYYWDTHFCSNGKQTSFPQFIVKFFCLPLK